MVASTIAKLPTRKFAAGFFAMVALSVATLLTPLLRPESVRLALTLPLLAAACAYVWAWLLYPRNDAKEYGPLRGVVVALLAYLSFACAAHSSSRICISPAASCSASRVVRWRTIF